MSPTVRTLLAAANLVLLVGWTAIAWPFLLPVYPEESPTALLADLPWHGEHTDEPDDYAWSRDWADGTWMGADPTLSPGLAKSIVFREPPPGITNVPPDLETLADSQSLRCFDDQPLSCFWSAQYGQFLVQLRSEQDQASRKRDIAVIDQNVAVQLRDGTTADHAQQAIRLAPVPVLVVGPWALSVYVWAVFVNRSRKGIGSARSPAVGPP